MDCHTHESLVFGGHRLQQLNLRSLDGGQVLSSDPGVSLVSKELIQNLLCPPRPQQGQMAGWLWQRVPTPKRMGSKGVLGAPWSLEDLWRRGPQRAEDQGRDNSLLGRELSACCLAAAHVCWHCHSPGLFYRRAMGGV